MGHNAFTPGDPFAFHVAPTTCLTRAASIAARPIIARALGLDRLRRTYELAARSAPGSFESRVLRALDIRFSTAGSTDRIPASGALIVAANHPTGALDGLVVAEVTRRIRPDVRLLTNHLLSRIPELRASCFFVDPFGGPAAAERSRAGLRAAHLWLRSGGALVMFPAGEVAWRRSPEGDPLDSVWAVTLGRLASATGAHVVPVFLDAQNSHMFYRAGRVHPFLRTALLGRELLNKSGTTVRVHVGPLVPPAPVKAAAVLTEAVRCAVDQLRPRRPAATTEIGRAVEPVLLARDVDGLPASAKLLSSGDYDVLCTDAGSIPNVLLEIGRLRELTFRAVGEGTGRAVDLDRYDLHYQHLFVWNRQSREVVGAYRVGATDAIVSAMGIPGLYTSTLFKYDEQLLDRIGPALELGRSFVRWEHQRTYSALLLLWKGIGQLVARSPRYRVLFGPVTISSRFKDASQQLLRTFLVRQHGESALTPLVHAINPPLSSAPVDDSTSLSSVDDLDSVIRTLEGGTGIPVLLRQYLRLNAALLGFNVDPAFGDALDALMTVDLARVKPALLHRYLGREGATAFLAYHQRATAA